MGVILNTFTIAKKALSTALLLALLSDPAVNVDTDNTSGVSGGSPDSGITIFSTLEDAQDAGVISDLPEDGAAYSHEEIIVVFSSPTPSADDIASVELSVSSISDSDAKATTELLGQSDGKMVAVVTLPDGAQVDEALLEAVNNEATVFVQPNYTYFLIDAENGESFDDESIEASSDQSISSLAGTNDPYYSEQWWLQTVRAEAAWGNLPANLPSVTVAIVDSGARLSHRDLENHLARSAQGDLLAWDAIEQTPLTNSTIFADYQGDQAGTLAGHGTHVAGIVAAESNNGVSIAGITDNRVRILPVRIFPATGSASSLYLIRAYNYLMEHAAETNLRVINLSLGSYNENDFDPAFRARITEARSLGILTVCAGGNGEGGLAVTKPIYPSDWPEVLSVTSVDINKEHAPYSDYNSSKDIAAPGGAGSQIIYSLSYTSDTGVAQKRGSSMACPMVAGIIAALFAVRPSLRPDAVIDIVCATAQDQVGGALDTPGRDDYFGFGIIDFQAALAETLSIRPAAVPIITVQPKGASYAQHASTATLFVVATSPDNGVLTYQWYSCQTSDINAAQKINGATLPSYKPSATNAGSVYYHCAVTNTTASVVPTSALSLSAVARVMVIGNELNMTVVTFASGLDASKSKILDIEGESLSNGANAILYNNHITPNQRFRLVQDPDGYYAIICINSGKVLDIYNNQIASNVQIIQYDDFRASNQRWIFIQNSNGSYAVASKQNSQYCLEVKGGVAANSSLIVLANMRSNAVSQQFYITKCVPVVSNGTYTMSSLIALDKVLDINNASQSPGAPAIIYTPNRGFNQRMTFTYQPDSGYYYITISHSGMVLDVNGLGRAPGTTVIQYPRNGGFNQLWDISVAADGSYIIRSACNDLALDIYQERTENCTPIIVWVYHGNANQRWRLISAA